MRIEVDGISKTYQSQSETPIEVTNGLSFGVEDGEFLCIVGPSGCGKTTLLSLIAGLLRPDSGVVRFLGKREADRPLTAVVWQDYALIPWRTVIDNVSFGLELKGMPKVERYARGRAFLELMGITGFERKHPYQLSGGMKQRVGLARALTSDPEVLLMDEPFAAVDAQTRQILQGELLALWARDMKTVVFITHSIDEALLLGDRVIVLSGRPSLVLEEIRVPFARPRDAEVERDPRFADLKLHVWALLKNQGSTAEVAG
ncbi:MAG: ABC transporter ATP-binding protein [Chloroflexota bacterium]